MLRHSRLPRVYPLVLVAMIVAVGAWLRFSELGTEAFWGDEFSYIYLDAESPAQHHLYSHGFDAYIRAYAVVTHCFGGTITDEFTMRFLPALLGTVAILLMYCVGRCCGSHAVGVLAAVFMAMHPFPVEHSRAATQYGHLLFGTSALVVGALAIVARPRWWAWLVLVAGSAFVFHLQVFFSCLVVSVWACLAAWMAGRAIARQPGAGRAILMMAIAAVTLAVVCLPEYWWYVRPSLSAAGRLNFTADQYSLWQKMDRAYVCSQLLAGRPWQKWFYIIVALVGFVRLSARRPFLPVLFAVTLAVTWIMLHWIKMESVIGVPPRYISFLLPMFWVMAAAGLWSIALAVGMCLCASVRLLWMLVTESQSG